MRNNYITFIPQWIDEAMARNSLSSDDLLNFERLAPFFSVEDLASILVIGQQSKLFTSTDVSPDQENLYGVWVTTPNLSARYKQLAEDANLLANQEMFVADTLKRLFGDARPEANEVPNTAVEQKETFVVSLLGNNGVKVVILEGFPQSAHAANTYKLFRCIVKKLYVYEEYHTLISRHVGRAYIETLLQ